MSVLINSKALLCKNRCVSQGGASKTGDLSHYMQASYDVIIALMTLGCMGIHYRVCVGHGTINFSIVVGRGKILIFHLLRHLTMENGLFICTSCSGCGGSGEDLLPGLRRCGCGRGVCYCVQSH